MRQIVPGLFLPLAIASAVTLSSPAQAQGTDANGAGKIGIAQPSSQTARRPETLNGQLQPAEKILAVGTAGTEAQSPAGDLETVNALVRQQLAGSMAAWPRIPLTPGGSAQQGAGTPAFTVMMQATRGNEDLKLEMVSSQAIDGERDAERKLLDDLDSELVKGKQQSLFCTAAVCPTLSGRAEPHKDAGSTLGRPPRFEVSPTMSNQQVANLQLEANQNLQSMNEVGDMTSMRLQMAVDRRSKFIRALTNIERKISNTSSAIVQNLK